MRWQDRTGDRAHPEDSRMSLAEHLRELRRRMIISALVIIAGTAVSFAFHGHIQHFLTKPYCDLPASYRFEPGKCTLVVTGVLDPFTVTLRLSFYAGLILSSPVWLWQAWKFITPGLYLRERRWALTFVGTSLGLFALGGMFAYLTLHKGLRFLLSFAQGTASGGLQSLLTFNSYLSYVVAIVLVFAISFEFPLVVVMLNLANVVSYARLRRWTRGIVFGIFAFAAVATPSQDPFTMLALAVPLCLLFALSLGIAKLHDRRMANRTSPYADLADDELSPLDDEPVSR
jgi:sec-independent protein translocase protein TatC